MPRPLESFSLVFLFVCLFPLSGLQSRRLQTAHTTDVKHTFGGTLPFSPATLLCLHPPNSPLLCLPSSQLLLARHMQACPWAGPLTHIKHLSCHGPYISCEPFTTLVYLKKLSQEKTRTPCRSYLLAGSGWLRPQSYAFCFHVPGPAHILSTSSFSLLQMFSRLL